MDPSTADSTQHFIEIARELEIPIEYITNVRQYDGFLEFLVNGACYTCKLTKTGRFKKRSIRKG